MFKRLFFPIFIIVNIVNIMPARAANEWILEAATGVASEALPFSSDWEGSIGSGGLQAREFAFRASFIYNSHLSASATFGHIYFWYEDENVHYSPPPPGYPYPYIYRDGKRKALYFRPTITLSSERGRLDLGIILYKEERFSSATNQYSSYDDDHGPFPVMGIELGDPGLYVYGRLANSFPLFTGGGAFEFGMGGRSGGIYEHKLYIGVSGSSGAGIAMIGYRGEFRVYKQVAIAPGFAIGGNDRDNLYIFTFGIKTILDHNQKKRF